MGLGYNQARMEEAPPDGPFPPLPSADLTDPAADRAESPETAVIEEAAEPLRPTQPDERVTLIDVLRGLALFGIIAANMRGFAGPLTSYFQPDLIWKSRSDLWVQGFIDAFGT
jgi:hypothetical protein